MEKRRTCRTKRSNSNSARQKKSASGSSDRLDLLAEALTDRVVTAIGNGAVDGLRDEEQVLAEEFYAEVLRRARYKALGAGAASRSVKLNTKVIYFLVPGTDLMADCILPEPNAGILSLEALQDDINLLAQKLASGTSDRFGLMEATNSRGDVILSGAPLWPQLSDDRRVFLTFAKTVSNQ
ncbi:MAG: hypothetical protein JO053_13585 [Acidobacteria bacterium]|nr:hypothetical protein [Acidobacteriota bacterium]